MDLIWGRPVRSERTELWEPAGTALVVVDVQNDFCHDDGYYGRIGKDLTEIKAAVPRVAALVDAARAAGVLVVWVQQTLLADAVSDSASWLRRRTGAGDIPPEWTLEGSWGQQFIEPLHPQPGEPTVKKHRSSAFVSTDLDLILRSNEIESLLICGTVTQGCVESTARDATFFDYYVTLVTDCVATINHELHEHSLACQASRYDFGTSDEIAGFWQQSRAAQTLTEAH
jgi:nicotinamidase-related amidase